MRAYAIAAATMAMIAATPAQAACQIGKLLEFPVTMEGLKPMVTASVDSHVAHFTADSGAFYSTITPGTAAEFGLRMKAAPENFHFRGIGGETDVRIATVKTLSVAGHAFTNVEFLVGGSEVGGAGLLGQNILGIADAEYDLAGGAIRLMRSHGCEHGNLAYWANGKPVSELSILPKAEAGNHTEGTVTLDGAKIRAAFDTGAGTTLLSTYAAARAGVHPDSPGVTPAGYSRGLGRKLIRTWIGTFKSLSVGDEQIQKIRLRFGDMGDSGFDMLIGADFFLSHRVYVDNEGHRLFFTYNGGPVFDLKTRLPGPDGDVDAAAKPGAATTASAASASASASASATAADATTAADYARRGAAEIARRDFAAALADLDRATTLAPDDAEYRYQHALVLADSKRPALARAEVDRALTLRPGDVEALMLRASLRFRGQDKPGARADLDAVSATVAQQADVRLELARHYEALGADPAAIDQLDRWIPAHPADSRLPDALNARCWTRALTNVSIPEAIADCNRSLHLNAHDSATLDSRGLAYLRSGDLDRAAKDYDAALALDPQLGWSLYGRGIVRIRRGQKAEGEADMAAAVKMRPAIAAMAEHYGIKP